MASKETPPLHLPSLSIKGFRGIKDLSISRLGRVTLLAGKNSSGKTTVLDAVRVYAARAHPNILSEVLKSHGEVAELTSSQGQKTNLDSRIEAIFHGRDASKDAIFTISPNDDSMRLVVEAINPEEERWPHRPPHYFSAVPLRTLIASFGDSKKIEIFWHFSPYTLSTKAARDRRVYQDAGSVREHEMPTPIVCESMGPGPLGSNETERFWDVIALTDKEEQIGSTLRLILDKKVERIAMIGNERESRRMVVRLEGQSFPVPIESFGDGALRLFGVALALINSKDGFLLIDEVENGIHHSIQHDLWRIILKIAAENNVQVLATTHSFDCVRGFAQAMTEYEESDGALVRIERKGEEMWAVEYSKDDLRVAAEQHIEVR